MTGEKEYYNGLKEKIEGRKAHVGILGLGYVGLPHAIHYAAQGFSVTGFDIDVRKVGRLNCGKSYIDDITDEQVQAYLQGNIFTDDMAALSEMDIIFIDVPTPIDVHNHPVLSYVKKATETVLKHLKPGMLVVLESTSYPTTTKDYLVTPLKKNALYKDTFRIGENVFIAFSPERVDPGNPVYHVHNTAKLVGGYTQRCTELAAMAIGDTAVPVSSPEVAETAKLYENTFRFVNIGLANELCKACDSIGISTDEVLSAAQTKPFGFMRFDPCVKIGGHCIGVDPYYLKWYVNAKDCETTILDAVGKTEHDMIPFLIRKIIKILVDHKKPIYETTIAVLGVTYKKDIADTRMSAAPELVKHLRAYNTDIRLFDSHVNRLKVDGENLPVHDVDYSEIGMADLTIILTDHSDVDYGQIVQVSPIIIDTKYVCDKTAGSKWYGL